MSVRWGKSAKSVFPFLLVSPLPVFLFFHVSVCHPPTSALAPPIVAGHPREPNSSGMRTYAELLLHLRCCVAMVGGVAADLSRHGAAGDASRSLSDGLHLRWAVLYVDWELEEVVLWCGAGAQSLARNASFSNSRLSMGCRVRSIPIAGERLLRSGPLVEGDWPISGR